MGCLSTVHAAAAAAADAGWDSRPNGASVDVCQRSAPRDSPSLCANQHTRAAQEAVCAWGKEFVKIGQNVAIGCIEYGTCL